MTNPGSPPFINVTGDLKISNVGLESIDQFFHYQGPGADLTTLVERIPNVHSLTYGDVERGNVAIYGNGKLNITFHSSLYDPANPKTGRYTVLQLGKLSISGVADLLQDETVGELYIGTLTAVNNTFETLRLSFENVTGGLQVADNRNLKELRFHVHANSWGWDEIRIKGNPLLRMSNSSYQAIAFSPVMRKPGADPTEPEFRWPFRNLSSMVFVGEFDNAFL